MVSIKISFIGFFFLLIFIFFDQVYNPIGNILLGATIVLAILTMSCVAFRDLYIGCHCKRKECDWCKDDKKYKKLFVAHLISYPLIYFLVSWWNSTESLLTTKLCGRWFGNSYIPLEDAAYCAEIEKYIGAILLLLMCAILLYLGSFWSLISETGKGEGVDITHVIYDYSGENYRDNENNQTISEDINKKE